MRFSLEHHFSAPVDVVEKASNDRAYQDQLDDLPNIAERRVTHLEERPDGSIHRVVRYRLGAQLPAPVAAVIGPAASWDEVGDFDATTHEWTFEIRPHVLAGRILCNGRYAFEPDGDGTKRLVDIDLKVKIPLVGGRVEKEIRKGLTETMDAEAKLLEDYLSK